MPNNDPTHPDQRTTELDPLGQPVPGPIPGATDWNSIARDIVGMLYAGARHSRQLWIARQNWLGLTEIERIDVIERIVTKAKQDITHGKKGRDAFDSTRVLEICSDLWHAIDHDREHRN